MQVPKAQYARCTPVADAIRTNFSATAPRLRVWERLETSEDLFSLLFWAHRNFKSVNLAPWPPELLNRPPLMHIRKVHMSDTSR